MHTNGEVYDFNKLTLLEQFYHNIISGKVSIKQAKNEQDRMNKMISDLEKYKPTKKDKRDERFLKMQKKNSMEEKILLRHLKKVFFQCLKKFSIKSRLKNKLKNKLKKKKRKERLI